MIHLLFKAVSKDNESSASLLLTSKVIDHLCIIRGKMDNNDINHSTALKFVDGLHPAL